MRNIEDILKIKSQTNWSVEPESTVINAMKLMKTKKASALPALKSGKLVDVITKTDYITKVILKGKLPDEFQVREALTRNTIYSTPAQTVKDCLAFMTEKHLQYLPVLKEGVLVGFVSSSDFYQPIITAQKDYIYRLENYVIDTGLNQ